MTTATLDAQTRLADIRLRVLNREAIGRDEYRDLLLSLSRERELEATAARSATNAKRRATTKLANSTPLQQLDLAKMFGPRK